VLDQHFMRRPFISQSSFCLNYLSVLMPLDSCKPNHPIATIRPLRNSLRRDLLSYKGRTLSTVLTGSPVVHTSTYKLDNAARLCCRREHPGMPAQSRAMVAALITPFPLVVLREPFRAQRSPGAGPVAPPTCRQLRTPHTPLSDNCSLSRRAWPNPLPLESCGAPSWISSHFSPSRFRYRGR
jgi:hypothetical protein